MRVDASIAIGTHAPACPPYLASLVEHAARLLYTPADIVDRGRWQFARGRS